VQPDIRERHRSGWLLGAGISREGGPSRRASPRFRGQNIDKGVICRSEGVYDRQAVQGPPILKVFRYKKAQADPDRRRAEQRIPEGDVVRADEIERRREIGRRRAAPRTRRTNLRAGAPQRR